MARSALPRVRIPRCVERAGRAPCRLPFRGRFRERSRLIEGHRERRSGRGPARVTARMEAVQVASVLETHLRVRVEWRRQPRLRGRPAVIVNRSEREPLVVARPKPREWLRG